MRTLILLFLTLVFVQCKSNKVASTEQNDAIIMFGNYGGFSGERTEFTLKQNGQFSKETFFRKSKKSLESLDKNLTTQMFNNFFSLGFDKLELNDPGNLSYFLTMKKGDIEHQIIWGGVTDDVPPTLKTFYKTLNNLAKKNESVTK